MACPRSHARAQCTRAHARDELFARAVARQGARNMRGHAHVHTRTHRREPRLDPLEQAPLLHPEAGRLEDTRRDVVRPTTSGASGALCEAVRRQRARCASTRRACTQAHARLRRARKAAPHTHQHTRACTSARSDVRPRTSPWPCAARRRRQRTTHRRRGARARWRRGLGRPRRAPAQRGRGRSPGAPRCHRRASRRPPGACRLGPCLGGTEGTRTGACEGARGGGGGGGGGGRRKEGMSERRYVRVCASAHSTSCRHGRAHARACAARVTHLAPALSIAATANGGAAPAAMSALAASAARQLEPLYDSSS